MRILLITLCALISLNGFSQLKNYEQKFSEIEDKVIEWRRHIHQHPELSNREFETAKYIAEQLRAMDIEVHEGIAKTGVVGVLRGNEPGATVGLRADIDALPVVERVDVPFASKVKTKYLNADVGVMHACGHDSHVAMLLGTAKILSDMRSELKGGVVFIFQPAEEGAPPGEEGGAKLMVKEGVLKRFGVDVIFGQHINSSTEVGTLKYKPKGIMAASDRFVIKVKGKQSHGSRPWTGVDPIVVASQIVIGLQTIISRQTDLTKEPAVISVGKISSGVRNNIIPEEAELIGTIRTFDTAMQADIHQRIEKTATLIAQSAGAEAEVNIYRGYPVTYNDVDLTEQMLPSLQRAVGKENIKLMNPTTGAEDFSFFAKEVPGLFYFVGGMPKGMDPNEASSHHTPDFYIDESGFISGVKSLTYLTLDYMAMHSMGQ